MPAERTLRDILNRMNYRLKRIQKGKPLKKTDATDAIFANVKQVQEQVRNDPEALEISMDTKAKVALGEYVRGGKTRTDGDGEGIKGWDHDPPAKEKLVPFGIPMVATRGVDAPVRLGRRPATRGSMRYRCCGPTAHR